MKKVKLFEEFISEYKKVSYDAKITGEYELSIGTKKYNINVAGSEREGDETDGLYLMDNDPQRDIIGSVIVKNSDMLKMSKGTKIDVSTSKNFKKGTLVKVLNKYTKLKESEEIYHDNDFLGMKAKEANMTREEWIAHYGTPTIGSGIDEAKESMYVVTFWDSNDNDTDYDVLAKSPKDAIELVKTGKARGPFDQGVPRGARNFTAMPKK
jgi:hypothetical protein